MKIFSRISIGQKTTNNIQEKFKILKLLVSGAHL